MFVKTGDKVKVISGKDKGKEGTIIKAMPKEAVLLLGINTIKSMLSQMLKPNGGIVDTEASIDASNVMLIDPSNNEATRVGYKVVDGKKVRVSKKTGESIDK